MKTMRTWSIGSCALIACAIAAAVLSGPAVALAKSYEIADLRIVATVDTAGGIRVDETRTFDFSGSFSWVEWKLAEKGAESIQIVSLHSGAGDATAFQFDNGYAVDPGTYSVTDDGTFLTVHAAISAADEQLPMHLVYIENGVVKRYSDCSELYGEFVGDGWSVPTRQVRIDIVPPAPLSASQVLGWAHGPLTGNVAIGADGVVSLTVADLPPDTFVAARVLYPADVLTGLAVSSEAHRDAAMAEEAAFANEANATRTRALAEYWAWMIGSLVLSLGGLAFVSWAFVRHGREYRAQFPGGYLREDPMPTLHPAVVGALWRLGEVRDSDIAATLMQLADKKIITMSPTTVDSSGLSGFFGGHTETYVLERVTGAAAPTPLDEQLMTILFDGAGDGTRVDLAALKEYAKANAKTYTSDIAAWKTAAGDEAKRLSLIEADSSSWQAGTWFVAVLIAGVGVGASVFTEEVVPLIVALAAAIACGVMSTFMRRRSREGNELYVKYRAVRDFLRDFSRLKEAPPASVILWNRFLVLAVVFGIADEVLKQLRDVAPQVVTDPGFQTTYWWVYAGSGVGSPINAVQSGFASAAQVATSQMSGAGGGGGGFSGGGGGGFGGGGGGAG